MEIHNIIEATPFEDYTILIRYNSGAERRVDIKPFIKKGVSSALSDIEYFKTVAVLDGFITWENGFDFCPNFLYNFVPNLNEEIITP